MEQVVIVNLDNNLFGKYKNYKGFHIYESKCKLINDVINKELDLELSIDFLFYIISPGVNIIISEYEFISPILEEKSKDYRFVELCIKQDEFKFYNFDESLVYDVIPEEFEVYSDNNDISKEYYLLIYKFLNRPSNIKSALS